MDILNFLAESKCDDKWFECVSNAQGKEKEAELVIWSQ